MAIELLGPLRVDGQDVSLQRRDQVVLLALAVQAGEVASADRLAEALWGDAVPPSWHKVVQGCVLRLRRRIEQSLIETVPGGYRLVVTAEALDSRRFEELIERGRVLAAAGEFDRSAVACGRALELWRGRPFDALDSWAPGRIEAARLDELRRSAEESVLEARLHSGEHREVVPIAEVRVSEEPLREHRWALLTLALYRCGRQADALRTLKRARHTLAEQLGIDPSAELVALEAAILRQDETLLAPPAPPTISDQCPYKGLAPYDTDDAETFFGRDGEVDSCLARLRTHPLLVVMGPSGCGKSSLVRAGLVPVLRRQGCVVALFHPGSDPDAAMASAVAACDRQPVLVVDQFEELLAFDDEVGTRLRGFSARLADYATNTAPVVITIRADRVAALAADPRFALLAERGVHLVTPLAGDALRRAIEGPAASAGLRLEPGLVDLLVRDCDGEPGAMPLLSHALAETWQRRDGRVLTVESYRATGEIRGAVARSADRLYEGLSADQRPKLRSVLLRLVSPAPNGEALRARVPTRVLGGDADRERLLNLLVRARLVTAQEDIVELAHEALARAWPRLRSWLDEDAAGQRILGHLSTAADGWEALGRPSAELYRGARLDAVLEWQATESPDLTKLEQAFLDASLAEATAERAMHADRVRQQVRQRRRLRRALAGVVVLLLAAAGGGVAAVRQRQTNQREQRQASVGALAIRSEALRASQADLAALLAAEAFSIEPSAVTESALFGALTTGTTPTSTRHTDLEVGFGRSVTMAPNGESLVLADRDGFVHVVDLEGGTRSLTPVSEVRGRTELAVSADGRYVAGLWRPLHEQDHSLLAVWDLRSGQPRFEPVRIERVARSVAISSDGSFIVVGNSAGPDEIRDGTTGVLQHEIDPLTQPVHADDVDTDTVAIASDNRVVLFSRAGPIRFIDPTSGVELQRIDAPAGAAADAAFISTDGSLVTVGNDGFIGWYENGRRMSPDPHPEQCQSTAYSEQLNAVLCGTRSGPVVAYNLVTGTEVDRFSRPSDDLCALAAGANGSTLVAVSSCEGRAIITVWRLDGSGPISRLVLPSTQERPALSWYGVGGNDTTLTALLDGSSETIAINTSNGEIVDRFPEVFAVLPTDDPRVGIAILYDETMARYDLVRHTSIDTVDPGFEIYDARVSGNSWTAGETVVVFGYDDGGDVRLQGVDHTTGRLVEPTIDGSGEFDVRAYEVTDDSVYVIVEPFGDQETRIERYDVDTGELVGEPLVGFHDFSLADDLLIVVTMDGRILEVDPDTSEPIGLPFPATIGPDDWTLLDPSAHRLLIRGADMTLRLYDVASRTPLGAAIALSGDPDGARAQFRPDGLELATDTGDGIIVWDLDPAHWVDAACRLAGRNLTEAEWDQYIDELAPYRQTCPA